MTEDELRKLLLLPEGLKLDFKQEYHLNKKSIPAGTKKQAWIEYVNGQWDELAKDIIALTNGNIGTANESAYLVIGAGDQMQDAGSRPLFDTKYLDLTEQQIIAAVNNRCTPAIALLRFHQIELDGPTISVITIPPSRYLHECSLDLEVSKGAFNAEGQFVATREKKMYTKYTAFIRNNDAISPASNFERRQIEDDKRFHLLSVNEGIKFELTQNLRFLLTKDGKSGTISDPTNAWSRYKTKYTFDLKEDFYMDRIEARVCWLLLVQANSAVSKMQTQFLDEAITSKHYLQLDGRTGKYMTNGFLKTLINLQQQIQQLAFTCSDKPSLIIRWTEGLRSDQLKVSASDALMAGAIFNIYTNVINLHTALLLVLYGYTDEVPGVDILAPAVNENMRIAVNEESVTDGDVLAWLSKRR